MVLCKGLPPGERVLLSVEFKVSHSRHHRSKAQGKAARKGKEQTGGKKRPNKGNKRSRCWVIIVELRVRRREGGGRQKRTIGASPVVDLLPPKKTANPDTRQEIKSPSAGGVLFGTNVRRQMLSRGQERERWSAAFAELNRRGPGEEQLVRRVYHLK